MRKRKLLSNSSLSLVRLGVDFLYPCHKKKKKKNNNKNKNNNPSPKSIRRGYTRRLKFEPKTTHGLAVEVENLALFTPPQTISGAGVEQVLPSLPGWYFLIRNIL